MRDSLPAVLIVIVTHAGACFTALKGRTAKIHALFLAAFLRQQYLCICLSTALLPANDVQDIAVLQQEAVFGGVSVACK